MDIAVVIYKVGGTEGWGLRSFWLKPLESGGCPQWGVESLLINILSYADDTTIWTSE